MSATTVARNVSVHMAGKELLGACRNLPIIYFLSLSVFFFFFFFFFGGGGGGAVSATLMEFRTKFIRVTLY